VNIPGVVADHSKAGEHATAVPQGTICGLLASEVQILAREP